MSRKPHTPTDESCHLVKTLAQTGIDQTTICKVLGITDKTLRLRYRDELDHAKLRANAQVAGHLFKVASGQLKDASVRDSVTAAIFWLKTQAGWKDTTQLQGEISIKMIQGDEKL